jgi:hypothetical protein
MAVTHTVFDPILGEQQMDLTQLVLRLEEFSVSPWRNVMFG